MTRNLLALLLALQRTMLDPETRRYSLRQLGNKLETLSKKKRLDKADRQNIQTKINNLLNENPILAQDYRQRLAQLQTWNDAELRTLLPSPEIITKIIAKSLQPPPTLGHSPGPFLPNTDELENNVVVVSQLILRHGDPEKMSKKLLRQADKFTKTKNPK
jgi:hypothetical protein